MISARGKRLYLIIQTALCVLLVSMLAAGIMSLYWDGVARRAQRPLESIYTREQVTEKLAPIAPIFLALVGLTVAGLCFKFSSRHVCEEPTPAGAVMIDRELLISHPLQPGRAERRGRAILMIAAVVLIVAGILNGSARDVLYKAVTICTECVGLG